MNANFERMITFPGRKNAVFEDQTLVPGEGALEITFAGSQHGTDVRGSVRICQTNLIPVIDTRRLNVLVKRNVVDMCEVI